MIKKRLLCVEDDSINAFIMEKLFSHEFDIRIVDNGDSCKEILENDRYDVVLMDINLGRGKKDGMEVLKEIRNIPGCNNIPVFAITSYAFPGDESKFLNAGFDNYFSKPLDKVKLAAAINQLEK